VVGRRAGVRGAAGSTSAYGRPRHLIVSGVVPDELDAVAADYSAAGWTVAARREEDGWGAALLEPAGA
jgi:ribosomal protein L11 methylase PrmA